MNQDERNELLRQKIIMALGGQAFHSLNLEVELEALRQQLMAGPEPEIEPADDTVETNTKPPEDKEKE